MTNLERIKSKDADKMASFIYDVTYHCNIEICDGCPLYNPVGFGCACYDFSTIKKFLESEAEE